MHGLAGVVLVGALVGAGALLLRSMHSLGVVAAIAGALLLLTASILVSGFVIVEPNQARVLTLFGKYVGTLQDSGFFWVTPLTGKYTVWLRVSNFISERMKVNDADGNPVEIAAVIVWKVQRPAQAVLDVMDYSGFVRIQAETALRKIAALFPYDAHGETRPSLRSSPEEICAALRKELQVHLEMAGITVHDTQISHLAYAPEIAQAMLRRQQAQAIIAARRQIVDGAVGMVEMALKQLGEKKVVELDEERKAQMVSNLLVTLVAESSIQPVVNTGTIY